MSLLAALARAYYRLPDAPPDGYSSEKIGFCVVLNLDGSVAAVEDLRGKDKRLSPRVLLVPQSVKRTAGISPNFLWDKTAYVLGVTAGEGRRTAEEHARFHKKHLEWLADSNDEGLVAFLRFLDTWVPQAFVSPLWREDMRDQNLVFALAGEFGDQYLHDRPASRAIWQRIRAEGASPSRICLVSGDAAPFARLHPAIKGIWGAQSSGASLVSFNLDAFTSYGHEQGDNAPVSEAVAFAYTTALNRFLSDGKHRVQIGDASTIFWTAAEEEAIAELADGWAAAMFGLPPDIASSAEEDNVEPQIATKLLRIRDGLSLREIEPRLADGVHFFVAGLSPNASRVSLRFWWEGRFDTWIMRYSGHLRDMQISPPPRNILPPFQCYLVELAVMNKHENVPPNLAGEWMRAILTGAPYPMTLLTTVLMRIRADGNVNALRAAMLKSVLIRNFKKEAPVALDPEFKESKGYLLGRLFATYEQVQRAALGGTLNVTIKDKSYGPASVSPQKVFATLNASAQNHFAKLRKVSPGWAHNLDRLIGEIMDLMSPSGDPIPAYLGPAEQGLFGLGYYHQQSDFYRKRDDRQDTRKGNQIKETDV